MSRDDESSSGLSEERLTLKAGSSQVSNQENFSIIVTSDPTEEVKGSEGNAETAIDGDTKNLAYGQPDMLQRKNIKSDFGNIYHMQARMVNHGDVYAYNSEGHDFVAFANPNKDRKAIIQSESIKVPLSTVSNDPNFIPKDDKDFTKKLLRNLYKLFLGESTEELKFEDYELPSDWKPETYIKSKIKSGFENLRMEINPKLYIFSFDVGSSTSLFIKFLKNLRLPNVKTLFIRFGIDVLNQYRDAAMIDFAAFKFFVMNNFPEKVKEIRVWVGPELTWEHGPKLLSYVLSILSSVRKKVKNRVVFYFQQVNWEIFENILHDYSHVKVKIKLGNPYFPFDNKSDYHKIVCKPEYRLNQLSNLLNAKEDYPGEKELISKILYIIKQMKLINQKIRIDYSERIIWLFQSENDSCLNYEKELRDATNDKYTSWLQVKFDDEYHFSYSRHIVTSRVWRWKKFRSGDSNSEDVKNNANEKGDKDKKKDMQVKNDPSVIEDVSKAYSLLKSIYYDLENNEEK